MHAGSTMPYLGAGPAPDEHVRRPAVGRIELERVEVGDELGQRRVLVLGETPLPGGVRDREVRVLAVVVHDEDDLVRDGSSWRAKGVGREWWRV